MEGSIRRVVFDSRQPPSAVVVSELADAAYGCHIWPSALVLSKLISDGSSSGSGSDCVRVAGCRVIELGAGVGLVGLAAAVVGGASVTVLTDSGDHPHILRNLATSLSLNSTGSHHIQIPPQMHVSAASWADFETLRRLIATHGPFDVILGADVLYEPAAFEDLVATVAFLLRNASPAAVFYTSYQERSARRQVHSLADRWGLDCRILPFDRSVLADVTLYDVAVEPAASEASRVTSAADIDGILSVFVLEMRLRQPLGTNSSSGSQS